MRPTYAQVNLKAIRSNLQEVRSEVGPVPKILVAVKANAYGHGLEQVAKTVLEAGADMLGVAFLEEGIQLRRLGIGAPILILGSELPERAGEIVRWGLRTTVCTYPLALALSEAAREQDRKVPVHLKVDTGMGRIGLKTGEILTFLEAISELDALVLEGIYTHLPVADALGERYTLAQIRRFGEVVRKIRAQGIRIPLAHCANSAAVIRYPEAHMDMVRPGVMIYGLEPFRGAGYQIQLKPALALKSHVCFLKTVRAKTAIGYGRTFIAEKQSRIATIPLGYGDGFSRNLSNRGQVLIHERRARIVGNICMDQMMVDVTDIKGIRVGDEVVLIGEQGAARISAEEVARLCGTINYEVVCALAQRVPRVYVDH
ncbi:MAG: alanine racemase [Candidatus Latescibacterota bacterium]